MVVWCFVSPTDVVFSQEPHLTAVPHAMSSLNDQLNSFRNRVKNAPIAPVKRVVEAQASSDGVSSSSPKTTSGGSSPPPKKKGRTGTVYSQPANTGIGTHHNTQLFHAVEFIKDAARPVSFNDIERYLSVPIQSILALLRGVDRVRINEAAKTAEYKSPYEIYNAEDLLRFLSAQPTFQGVSVKMLKDGWSGYLGSIEELEKSQDILVLRTKKENSPRFVWANRGGPIGGVADEYVKLWASVKVPSASELPDLLDKAGLKPASVDPATVKKLQGPTEHRKQKKPRRGKMTNTHMRGMLKEYNI